MLSHDPQGTNPRKDPLKELTRRSKVGVVFPKPAKSCSLSSFLLLLKKMPMVSNLHTYPSPSPL